ncbi:MAG: glycoside hydrolase family 2 [Tannerella sp.]|nr:glycoside hydrolase family 2 [Tannerella sp.]
MKKILLSGCIFLVGCTGQKPATDYNLGFSVSADLEAGFATPPSYAEAGAFWMWLEGNISKEGILSDLTEMKRVGINNPTVFDASVCPGTTYGTLTERPAAGPVFMSPEWRELFVYTCRVADSLDMDISLNICSGWNSGGAWVTPEHAAKKIVWSEIVVDGPKQISEQLPLPKGLLTDERTGKPFYELVAVLALKLAANSDSVQPLENFHLKAVHSIGIPATNNGLGYDWASLLKEEPSRENDRHACLKEVIDITDKTDAEGHLSWDAPEGRYLIMRFVYTGTGIRVSSHSPGGGGLVIDYLKREAMKMYYDRTVKPVLNELKSAGVKNPKYLFEDSWELNAVNWTEGFEQYFKKVHGYDLLPYLPAIAGRVIESREASNRFLYDFRRAIGDLIWENHYKYVKELARNDGLGYHPESGGPHPAPIDALKNEGINDIPMGEFWLRSNTHRVTPDRRFYVKQPASAAHIYGRRFVAAEGLTSIGPHWEEDFAYMKPTLDRAYCEGLNHLVICTFSHSPKEAGKPGTEFFAGTHFNPNTTWWKQAPAFLAWSNRVSFMLSQGLFIGDVCYYYGDNVPNQVPMKHVNADLGEGYDYDVCNTEVILDRMSVRDGKIILPDGMSYHALVLPKHKGVSPEAAKKIKSMKKAGATIIDLHTGENTRDALLKKGVIPDFIYESRKPNALIDYIHRRTDSVEIYYVVNRNEQPEYLRVSFRVEGRMPELWHPETGAINEYPVYQTAAGRTTLPLFLEPFGSVFVVFRKPQAAAHYESISFDGKNLFPELPQDTFDTQPFVFQKDGKHLPLLAGNWTLSSYEGKTQTFDAGIETIPVDAAWEVRFDTAWGGPEKIRFDKLVLWNEHPDDGIRYYSGTAEYATVFRLRAEQRRDKRVYLDLGELYNLAEVHVNGQPAGVWWQPPFSQDITDLLKDGENTLQIQVVNLWPNRLIGDQFLPEEKRFTKTNIKKFRKEHPLRPSGLAGPVTIRIF